MGDASKKISFGFSKLAKKTAIVPSQLNKPKPQENQVELIDCFEGKSIKLKDPVKFENKVLVIPLKRNLVNDNRSIEQDLSGSANLTSVRNPPNTAAQDGTAQEINESDKQITIKSEHLTLDEIAAKEILEDLNKKNDEETRVFSVPLTSNAPTGEKESTIDDYENIPVNAFGMAMLRGMGWSPGKGIGKNEKVATPSMPTLRPKGMGLGADKVIKIVTENNKTNNEDLKMVKGSYVRIIAGAHKDSYGQIEGFDDESGRMIVKLALKNTTVSLNEFMAQLVNKSDFTKNSKVINVGKYEQYKDEEMNGKQLRENSSNENEKKTDYGIKSKSKSSKGYKRSLSPDHKYVDNIKSINNDKSVNKDKIISRSNSASSSDNNYRRRKRSRSRSKKRSRSSSSNRSDNIYRRKRRSRSHSRRRTSTKRSSSTGRYKIRDKHRERSASNSVSRSESSDDSGHRYKSRTKKKKPSSHKYKSRSRSRTPKKHKSHKKHKKSKV